MTLTEIVEAMSKVNVLVVGDAILDEYVFGRVDRLCPEAPVPAFIPERTEGREGGAMNVTAQIRALGAYGYAAYGYPYSTKRRYMVGHQMLLREDRDLQATTSFEKMSAALSESILGESKLDVIVLSDYAKGTLTPELCQWLLKFANSNGIPVVVDPKGTDWSKYKGANIICPNHKEFVPGTDFVVAEKRGERGIRVHHPFGGGQVDFPATAHEVFDVTGAGDVAVAVIAAAMATGAHLYDAVLLGNIAAGHTVGLIGTTNCPREVLLTLAREHDTKITERKS